MPTFLGPDALIVLVVAVVLLFGANRLPGLARSLGEASREFKQGRADSAGGNAGAAVSPPDADKITLTEAELDSRLTERGEGPT